MRRTAAALVVMLAFAGCGGGDDDLADRVADVRRAAETGELPLAYQRLEALRTEVGARRRAGELSTEEAGRIEAAIENVRGEMIVAFPALAPTTTTTTTTLPPPSADEDDDKDDDDEGRGRGNGKGRDRGRADD